MESRDMEFEKAEKKYEGVIPDAMLFAFNAHAGQYRKDLPQQYIIHPLRVSEFLLKNFPEHPSLDSMRAAAILHDTIEDTWVTEQDIEQQFGAKIARLVRALSKDDAPKEISDRKESIKNYLIILEEGSDEAKIIKLADIFDNVVLSTNNPKQWKAFIEDCKFVLENINLENHNPRFDKIKQDLMKIINMKLKDNE